jgi:hypothetical protein
LWVGFVVARKTQEKEEDYDDDDDDVVVCQLLRLEEGSGEVERLGFCFP